MVRPLMEDFFSTPVLDMLAPSMWCEQPGEDVGV